jgi:SNF2 family DNA or RNA helicase
MHSTHVPGSLAVRKAVLTDDPSSDAEPTTSREVAAHRPDMVRFDGGFALQASTYDRLFPYQQVGVKWLWELHVQRAGGELPSPMVFQSCSLWSAA